jgi:hypothetical protein
LITERFTAPGGRHDEDAPVRLGIAGLADRDERLDGLALPWAEALDP